MPKYEYECKSCYNRFEKVNIPMSDVKKTKTCPKCGKRAKKIFSTVNLIIN